MKESAPLQKRELAGKPPDTPRDDAAAQPSFDLSSLEQAADVTAEDWMKYTQDRMSQFEAFVGR